MRDVHTAMKIDSEGSTEKSDRLIEAARKRKDWVLRSGEDILNGKKCGWLHKQGKVVKNWKRRWFVLDYPKLKYYSNPNDLSTPKGEIDCEQITLTAPQQVALGVVTGMIKGLIAAIVAYGVSHDVVYVRYHQEKELILWWWKVRDLLWKILCLAYVTFCTFYVVSFRCIVSEDTFESYATSSMFGLLAILVFKPGIYCVVVFVVLVLARCFKFGCIQRFIKRNPSIVDFSYETTFKETAKRVNTEHTWLEHAPEGHRTHFILAVVRCHRE